MIRKIFASFFVEGFILLSIPLLLISCLFLTLLNPDYIKKEVIPPSYNIAIDLLAKKFEEEKIAVPQGKSPAEWLILVLPKEAYKENLSELINELFIGLQTIKPGQKQEIVFKNTKQKLLNSFKNALYSLPTCTFAEGGRLGQGSGAFPTCFPKGFSDNQKHVFIANILQEFDAGLPTRITIDAKKYATPVTILGLFAKYRWMVPILAFFVLALLLAFASLILWRVRSIFVLYGSGFLILSFESFAFLLLISRLPELIPSIPSEIAQIGLFFLQFPEQWFLNSSVILAVIGFALLVLSRRFKAKASPVKEESSLVSKPLIIRSGKLKKGSAK